MDASLEEFEDGEVKDQIVAVLAFLSEFEEVQAAGKRPLELTKATLERHAEEATRHHEQAAQHQEHLKSEMAKLREAMPTLRKLRVGEDAAAGAGSDVEEERAAPGGDADAVPSAAAWQ